MGDPAIGVAWEEPGPRETTSTVLRLHVDAVAHGPTGQRRNAKPQAKSATTVAKVCRHSPDYQNNEKTAVKHIETRKASRLFPE